jgi:hypothetical protein
MAQKIKITVIDKSLFSPHLEWVDTTDKDPEWMKLPRGDTAIKNKILSAAVAKTTTRVMEDLWLLCLNEAITSLVQELQTDRENQRRLEELRSLYFNMFLTFRKRAEAMQRSEEEDEARYREQERKEREAAEAAEAAEEAALAEEEEALAATEEARAVESLEKQNETSEGKIMNAHMLGASRPSVTMAASEPNTPIFGPSTTAASASAATAGSTSASASAMSTVW